MTLNQSMLDVCEEALLLLRQDVTLPTLAEAPAATDMEWLKCRKALEYAASEVLAAHDWTFATTDAIKTDLSKWPANLRKVLVYALARDLAVQIAGRTEDLKNFHALYEKMLVDARVKDLSDLLKTNADPILAELVANIRLDDPGLPRTVAVYTARRNAAFAEAEKEVKETLGIATLEGSIPLQAANSLTVAKLSSACGLDANVRQLKMQEYLTQIVEWRKLKLNQALEKNSDPVLAELLANFRSDDTGLVNAFTIFTTRAEAIKESAAIEINAAHNWQKAFAASDKKHPAWSAYLSLCVSKLAIPCGLPAEAIAALEGKYQLRLKEARVADLESSPLPDGPIGDVLVFLRGTFSAAEAALPRDLKSLSDKAGRLMASARKEVLAAHPWSFAQDEDATPCIRVKTPGAAEYGYAVDVPADAIKVTAVYGPHGLLKATRQIAGQIRAVDPIVRIVYTRNVEAWDELSTDAQRLVVLRLASDMAKAIGAEESARKLQEQLYRDALAEAKYRDTRETEPGRSVWGKNHYVEQMRGDVLER